MDDEPAQSPLWHFTAEQNRRLFLEAESRRQRLERLHARLVARGMNANHPYRKAVRLGLLGARADVLALVDEWQKGEYRRFMRRAQWWPRL